MSWLILGLFLLYFLSGTHTKVLNHFGLTSRDDKLMWIGAFIPGVFTSAFALFGAISAGTSFLLPIVLLVFHCGFIYFNYKGL